jgi:DNA-3-methyladenine glycosylase II
MRKAITHLKNADPVLAAIIERVGPYGIKFLDPDFETLVKSIVSQQLSGKVAKTIYGRLIEAAGGKLTPESLLKLRPTRLRALGLSRQKIEYIRDLARHSRSGSVDFTQLPGCTDDEVIEHLTAVKGIGVWTAHMFLIFALRRPNVLPTGDLGIRAAIRKAYGLEDLPKPTAIEEMARDWHPYCSVASWYLWRSLETNAGL